MVSENQGLLPTTPLNATEGSRKSSDGVQPSRSAPDEVLNIDRKLAARLMAIIESPSPQAVISDDGGVYDSEQARPTHAFRHSQWADRVRLAKVNLIGLVRDALTIPSVDRLELTEEDHRRTP